MDIINKLVPPGMILVLTISSGFWLSHTAKPLNNAIFTIHKLIALAAVVFLAFTLRTLLLTTPAQSVVVALLILCGLGVLALFASGALMSMKKLDYSLLQNVHRLATGIFILSLGAAVYFFNRLVTAAG